MKYIIVVGLFAFACAPSAPSAPASKAAPEPAPSATDDLASLLADGEVLLLDVRTPGEFAGGHIPGAVNVPLAELQRAAKLIGRKDRPVVVYCLSGGRSGRAEAKLRAEGFTRLRNGGGVGALAKRMGVTLAK